MSTDFKNTVLRKTRLKQKATHRDPNGREFKILSSRILLRLTWNFRKIFLTCTKNYEKNRFFKVSKLRVSQKNEKKVLNAVLGYSSSFFCYIFVCFFYLHFFSSSKRHEAFFSRGMILWREAELAHGGGGGGGFPALAYVSLPCQTKEQMNIDSSLSPASVLGYIIQVEIERRNSWLVTSKKLFYTSSCNLPLSLSLSVVLSRFSPVILERLTLMLTSATAWRV